MTDGWRRSADSETVSKMGGPQPPHICWTFWIVGLSAATYPAKSGQNSVLGKMKSFQKLDLGSSITLFSGFIWV